MPAVCSYLLVTEGIGAAYAVINAAANHASAWTTQTAVKDSCDETNSSCRNSFDMVVLWA